MRSIRVHTYTQARHRHESITTQRAHSPINMEGIIRKPSYILDPFTTQYHSLYTPHHTFHAILSKLNKKRQDFGSEHFKSRLQSTLLCTCHSPPLSSCVVKKVRHARQRRTVAPHNRIRRLIHRHVLFLQRALPGRSPLRFRATKSARRPGRPGKLPHDTCPGLRLHGWTITLIASRAFMAR